MYSNRKAGMVLLSLMLIILILPGCNQNQQKASQTLSGNDSATLQSSTTKGTNSTLVDPSKAAESEKWLAKGLDFYGRYQYRDAIAAFDKAIDENPDNYKVYSAKGITLCFQGNYKQGMDMINKTLEMKPDYFAAFYDMAMAYKLQKNYDKSLVWFEKNIKADPENVWSYYGISTIYADRGEFNNSLVYLKKAIELDSGVKEVAAAQDHFIKMRSMAEFQALVKRDKQW